MPSGHRSPLQRQGRAPLRCTAFESLSEVEMSFLWQSLTNSYLMSLCRWRSRELCICRLNACKLYVVRSHGTPSAFLAGLTLWWDVILNKVRRARCCMQREKLRALQQRPSGTKVPRVRNWNVVDDSMAA